MKTFCLEEYVKRNFNYLSRMVDGDNLPYFNIFWTDPAEAAHDWPDFGDVMTRQLQAAIMARHTTGIRLPIEAVWLEKGLSLLNPETGLLTRPATSFCKSETDMGDQALTLYAFATAYQDPHDVRLREAILRMCGSMAERIRSEENGDWQDGFAVKSLMACVRQLGSMEALEAASIEVGRIFGGTSVFGSDNTFRHGGHMHGNLRCLVGAADYALYTGDEALLSRIDAIYHYVRSTATSFGFLPEIIGRTDDTVACETCALMDYIGLAVTLANHGHPEYWGDIERVVRNQLVENQVTDVSWLVSVPQGEDTEQSSFRSIGERMVGGYAGWSSPNHILAYREALFAGWGVPELLGKTRAFQNCCGGSGTHAFHIAWKNASQFRNGHLSVNLHIDKLLPQAEIRCRQPFEGLLTVELKEAARVMVRIPDFTNVDDITVESLAGEEVPVICGEYLDLGQRSAGENIKFRYPLPIRSEEVTIGNPEGRKYHYSVLWKGDTVVRLEPVGNEYATGYSDCEGKQVAVYYGKEGPGTLYQRESLLNGQDPELSEIHMDDGGINFWSDLSNPFKDIAP